MTTEDSNEVAKLTRLNANLVKIEGLSQRMIAAMSQRKQADAALYGPDQAVYMKAATAYVTEMMQNPGKVMQHQVSYWGKNLQHYIEAQQALATGVFKAPADPTPKDRRFANPLWETHPFFNFVKQQYLMNAEAVTNAVAALDLLDDADRRRADYFTRQIIDMFAPTNFLATNPDALERAVETDGESLVQGLENLVRDIESHHGDLAVTLADKAAFQVGRNLATTPGSVVFRNKMLELIQYAPTTETVYQTPLLIFPPWINKFYVLDLKDQNSMIKWMVDQGFTVFVVSWVNPDATYADVGMDDYIRDGFLRAMAEVRRITNEPQINAVGYCIGGTTLSATLAHLEKMGDKTVKSATLFTTMTDFSDPGEVGVFLDNDFVDGIERQVATDGVMSSVFMSRTFSYLRSNDLIYKPAIRSYMMGEAPPAFDLLFWNGDGTNLPGKMAVEYLRRLCQNDELANGKFPVFGDPVSLAAITIPIMAIACETDHIAAWKSSLNGIRRFGSQDKTFIVSQSGHIAGIVNPPSKNKYGHYTNAGPLIEPDAWFAAATFTPGSWWPRWRDWLVKQSGGQTKARIPGDSTNAVLAAAPGTYVNATPSP